MASEEQKLARFHRLLKATPSYQHWKPNEELLQCIASIPESHCMFASTRIFNILAGLNSEGDRFSAPTTIVEAIRMAGWLYALPNIGRKTVDAFIFTLEDYGAKKSLISELEPDEQLVNYVAGVIYERPFFTGAGSFDKPSWEEANAGQRKRYLDDARVAIIAYEKVKRGEVRLNGS